MPPAFTQNVGRDALRDPFRRLAHRIAREMRIARRGLDPGVTQEFPDHGKALAQRQGPACKGMTKIMNRKHASSLHPEYPPRCSRRCALRPLSPSRAPGAHSAPLFLSACGPTTSRSSGGTPPAPGRGWRRNGEDCLGVHSRFCTREIVLMAAQKHAFLVKEEIG